MLRPLPNAAPPSSSRPERACSHFPACLLICKAEGCHPASWEHQVTSVPEGSGVQEALNKYSDYRTGGQESHSVCTQAVTHGG